MSVWRIRGCCDLSGDFGTPKKDLWKLAVTTWGYLGFIYPEISETLEGYGKTPYPQVGALTSPLAGKQSSFKISTMRFRVATCGDGNTPETSQSQKRTEFSKGLGETWGYTHKWGRHFPHLCGNQFLPKSQKPQVYHKAINPDMKSHTRLLWCGFGGSSAAAGYINIISTPYCAFFRMNTPARTNDRGIARNDAQMDHRPDALLFAPRLQHRTVSAVLRSTQGDSCHL